MSYAFKSFLPFGGTACPDRNVSGGRGPQFRDNGYRPQWILKTGIL